MTSHFGSFFVSYLGAIQHRRQLKAPPRLFTDKEEQILAGWCLYKDLVSESSTSTSFRAFAMTHFGRAIKPSYMSKFMRRHRLSLKLVGNAKRSERDESTVSMALSYLEKVRFLTSKCGVDHSRIVVRTIVSVIVRVLNFRSWIKLIFTVHLFININATLGRAARRNRGKLHQI